jgi:hypothetical protein
VETTPTIAIHNVHARLNVANQLKGMYLCQPRTHKWWHRLLYFVFSMSLGYVFYPQINHEEDGHPQKTIETYVFPQCNGKVIDHKLDGQVEPHINLRAYMNMDP